MLRARRLRSAVLTTIAVLAMTLMPLSSAQADALNCMAWDNGCWCSWIWSCETGECLSTLPGTGCWHVEQ